MKLNYRKLNKKETEKTIIQILEVLLDDSLPFSGKHRKEQWQSGWFENLVEGNVNPHYFGKYKINRRGGVFVEALSKNYERDMLYKILDLYFKKYLTKVKYIYEFGCGTGHNMLRVKKINPKAILCGLDWVSSSQEIVERLNLRSFQFDFFHPDYRLKLVPPAGIYTVAALEQTGTNYKKFIRYLLKNKPAICLHIEPIEELLDPNNLMDYLSIKYFHKRKYLRGFLTYLRELEKEGKIKIHEAKRNHIGSLFIEGYSVIVWSPL